ncbi:hypothetical protein [Pimelobacter simplex]|uniref:hypothetical protein n=1 Tax=Nocardioides simplex TaxID=2045 RepID=UPI0019347F0F|nr:hypothetical protein [Pimelobacter simplex]
MIDHVRLTSSGEIALRDRLQSNAELHVAALQSFGLDLRIGALPGEYCPGEFSVNLAGIVKVSGSAQRTTKNGWLLSTVVQVLGSESLRQVLSACHDALGYPFDPDTVGTLADLDPGIEADAVRSRLIGAYPITGRRAMSDVPPDVHSKAEELARLATPC